MSPNFLQTIWFLLVMFLIAGYAVLDGFDLGVGTLSLFRREPGDRRLMMNAIGPVWDGNEVWLLTGGGALFAAFPPVYATVFSGFYLALMLLLLFLILRAVSMEFRGQVDSGRWRRFWDLAFGFGSAVPALLFGVAVGNILRGIPLDSAGRFAGSFLGLLNPYALVVGLLSLAMFACHGALYMAMKSEGELREDMERWAIRGWIAWVVLYTAATLLSFLLAPHLFADVFSNPAAWVFFLLLLAALVTLPVFLRAGYRGRAFLASSAGIVSSIGVAAAGLFPRLVPSVTDLSGSLTAANASSTDRTLLTMLVIALVGMPFVIGYTIWAYRTFKGKVTLTEESY